MTNDSRTRSFRPDVTSPATPARDHGIPTSGKESELRTRKSRMNVFLDLESYLQSSKALRVPHNRCGRCGLQGGTNQQPSLQIQDTRRIRCVRRTCNLGEARCFSLRSCHVTRCHGGSCRVGRSGSTSPALNTSSSHLLEREGRCSVGSHVENR